MDLAMDFQDASGPSDTYNELDRRHAEYPLRSDLFIDLDYPMIPAKGWNPTVAEMDAWIRDRRAENRGNAPPWRTTHWQYRTSPSGEGIHLNVTVEVQSNGHARAPTPSECLMIRQTLHEDPKRLICDSRRALTEPIYLSGYLNDRKPVVKRGPDGEPVKNPSGRGYLRVTGYAGRWRGPK